MTTIATDGLQMAGDGRTSAGGGVMSDRSRKVHHLADGSVIGGAGEAPENKNAIDAIAEGLASGEPVVKVTGKFTLLRLMPNGKVRHYYQTNQHYVVIDSPAAIGSGGDYARGAMAAGLDATSAVKIAAKLDVYSGGRIRTLAPRP